MCMLGIPAIVKLILEVSDSRKLLYKNFKSILIVYLYVISYEKKFNLKNNSIKYLVSEMQRIALMDCR